MSQETVFASHEARLPPATPGFGHIQRYWDKTRETAIAKILPGEYYVTLYNEGIMTVLGSCISACIRDGHSGIGGMNHFMLPVMREGAGVERARGPSPALRYGSFAMEALVNDILKHGGRRDRLEVKIFGGGKVLAYMTNIGRLNIAFVREYLETEGLRLAAEDVGDIYPRKLAYFPASGRAQVKKLRTLHNDTIMQRETRYLNDLTTRPVGGSVDLF